MKILLASDSYAFTTSGVTNVVRTLEEGLRRRGFEVKVLSLSKGKTSYRQGDDYLIRSSYSFVYPEIRFSFARSDALLDELVQWKPDLIHLHTEGSIARMTRDIAEKTNAPIVMTAHTDYAYYAFGRFHKTWPVRKFMEALGKRVYRKVDTVIAPSAKAGSFSQLQAVKDRTVILPNGIHLEKYRKPVSAQEKEALFRKYGLTDNGCTLAMITRVSREKNIMEILRFLPALFRELPNAQLIIVGDGLDRERLEAYCRNHQLAGRVVFAGMIPPEEVYRYYAMGDVFVSASQFEVHSMSYLEALAGGLPLVCREDDSLLGVLDSGENGFTYRTEQEFVTAVTTILRDRAALSRMRENAKRKADAFSDERFIENTARLYESILSRRNASAD